MKPAKKRRSNSVKAHQISISAPAVGNWNEFQTVLMCSVLRGINRDDIAFALPRSLSLSLSPSFLPAPVLPLARNYDLGSVELSTKLGKHPTQIVTITWLV